MGLAGRMLVAVLALTSGAPTSLAGNQASATGPLDELPQSLLDTGLYVAGSASQVHPDNLPFTPQYPLWSDGAAKRRWLNLPPATWIDASRPDAWEFPAGTRLWKEFSHAGKRIETRLIQRRTDKSWLYVSYVWNGDGTDAALAPAGGVVLDDTPASTGRYDVPSRMDCLACHEGAAVPVLGASAVQLSTMDRQALAARGLLRNLPQSWQRQSPVIAAASETERAALGYLHGNCGHCHNHDGAPAPVQLVLAQSAAAPDTSRHRVLLSAINARSRYRPPGMPGDPVVIAPGRPEASVIEWRMRSRHPLVQMPPLGTLAPDPEGIALIRRWIANDLSNTNKEPLK